MTPLACYENEQRRLRMFEERVRTARLQGDRDTARRAAEACRERLARDLFYALSPAERARVSPRP